MSAIIEHAELLALTLTPFVLDTTGVGAGRTAGLPTILQLGKNHFKHGKIRVLYRVCYL